MLRRSPGLSLAAVLFLALGIGGITAVFSVVDTAILHPLPFPHSENLYEVVDAPWPPFGDAFAWWAKGAGLMDLAMFRTGGVNLSEGKTALRVSACAVSPTFFKVLATNPKFGRAFQAAEASPGHSRVVIISYRLWSEQFARDASTLGRRILLNGEPHTIIGVMPQGFAFPGRIALWIPATFSTHGSAGELDLGAYQQLDIPTSLQFGMVGRLHSGATRAQAQAQLQLVADQMPTKFARSGVSFEGIRVRLVPLGELLARNYRLSVLALFGAVAIATLIACANTSNLLLVRLISRRNEFGVRVALGATRFRLATQLMVESAVLSVAGGFCGIIFAGWAISLVRYLGPVTIPGLQRSGLDPRVAGFATGVSLLAGLAIGLILAFNASGADLNHRFVGRELPVRGRSFAITRGAIVCLMVALAFVLLNSSGLSLRTLGKLTNAPVGFNSRRVLAFQIGLPRAAYPKVGDVSLFSQRLFPRLMALPGVSAVGSVDRLPIGALNSFSLYVDVSGASSSVEQGMTHFLTVGGDFFQVMGVPLAYGGRFFRTEDDEAAPRVAIVNKSFVARYFRGNSAVGKLIQVEGEEGPREVIGVVGDMRDAALNTAPGPQLFFPALQPFRGQPVTAFAVVVKTKWNPGTLVHAVAGAVSEADSQIPAFRVRTMGQILYGAAAQVRFRTLLLSAFGSFSLIMALAGVYSVVSWSVNSGSHDIAIRMALGAQPGSIFATVISEGLSVSTVGIALGLVLSVGLNRMMASLLYGVKPIDPITYSAAAAVLVAGVLAGCYIPARRATHVNALSELRHE